MPPWRQADLGAEHFFSRWTPFRSDVKYNVRNPADLDVSVYSPRPPRILYVFLRHFLAFFACCYLISLFHNHLESLGLRCHEIPADVDEIGNRESQEQSSFIHVWAEPILTTGACFLIAQGYYGYVLSAWPAPCPSDWAACQSQNRAGVHGESAPDCHYARLLIYQDNHCQQRRRPR